MQSRTRSRNSKINIADNRRLNFYAAVFDEMTEVYDFKPGERKRSRYHEVIKPGAFTKSLDGRAEVLATIDHKDSQTFAKRSDGSLLLQQDPMGLFASAWVPETKLGDQLLDDVREGRMTGCSFRMGFPGTVEKWTGETCELTAIMLEDVTVTDSPYYPGASVMRSKAYLDEILARYAYMKFKAKNTRYIQS